VIYYVDSDDIFVFLCIFRNCSIDQSDCLEVEPTEFKTQQPSRRNVCQFFTPYKRSVNKATSKSTVVMSSVLNPPLKLCDKYASGVEQIVLCNRAASSTCNKTLKSNDVNMNLAKHVESVSSTCLQLESTDNAMMMCGNESDAAASSFKETDCKIVGTEHQDKYLLAKQAQLDRIEVKQHRSDVAVSAGNYWLIRKSLKRERISLKKAVDGRCPSCLPPDQVSLY